MCGIVGAWGPGGRVLQPVLSAMEKLGHRGPDGSGLHLGEAGVLGHRRLSIVGGAGGAQPLSNEDRSISVVYNGEIYNHAALRRRLRGRHQLGSDSDGEVIAHLYEDEGPQFVKRLRGMFAIALVEGDRLLLARDPLGIKPLYWSRGGEGTFFASEIGALLGMCDPGSIQSFPPGHVYVSDSGMEQALQLPAPDDLLQVDEEVWVRRLRQVLASAVRRRLMSDGPVGVLLSGGLDSSLIAALAASMGKQLRTFAVGVPGSPDLEQAARVARYLGTQHHEAYLALPEVHAELPAIMRRLESFDSDLIQSAVPCWFVSRLASRHVKVVLTGEGADELFAGYGYHDQYLGQPEQLKLELRRLLQNLHHMNLQRVDRMSMAHGLEARVPFLDIDFIRLALSVPARLKLSRSANKYLLRRVAEQLLPPEVAWRPKQQFDEGSGAAALVRSLATPAAFRREFFNAFPREVEALVARWRSGRVCPN